MDLIKMVALPLSISLIPLFGSEKPKTMDAISRFWSIRAVRSAAGSGLVRDPAFEVGSKTYSFISNGNAYLFSPTAKGTALSQVIRSPAAPPKEHLDHLLFSKGQFFALGDRGFYRTQGDSWIFEGGYSEKIDTIENRNFTREVTLTSDGKLIFIATPSNFITVFDPATQSTLKTYKYSKWNQEMLWGLSSLVARYGDNFLMYSGLTGKMLIYDYHNNDIKEVHVPWETDTTIKKDGRSSDELDIPFPYIDQILAIPGNNNDFVVTFKLRHKLIPEKLLPDSKEIDDSKKQDARYHMIVDISSGDIRKLEPLNNERVYLWPDKNGKLHPISKIIKANSFEMGKRK